MNILDDTTTIKYFLLIWYNILFPNKKVWVNPKLFFLRLIYIDLIL